MSENKDNKFGEVDEDMIKEASKAAPSDLKEKAPINVGNEILDWLESFVFAMFVVILIFIFFFRIVLVDGSSMNNTLNDGDRLVMTHINYTPEKDDIVVVNSAILNKTIIKRVIGTAGDKIKIDYNCNTVYVNDKAIDNEHIKEPMADSLYFLDTLSVKDDTQNVNTDDGVYEYSVPEGYIFVMGDNRNNSTDSRRLGYVNTEDVLGKAVLRLFPIGNFGTIK